MSNILVVYFRLWITDNLLTLEYSAIISLSVDIIKRRIKNFLYIGPFYHLLQFMMIHSNTITFVLVAIVLIVNLS